MNWELNEGSGSTQDRNERTIGQRVVRGAPWVAAAAWTNRVMLALVVVVLASELTAREFGLLSVVLFLSSFLMVINDLGFAHALIYQRRWVRQAAHVVFLVTILAGVVLALGMVLGAPLLGRFFRVPGAVALIRVYGGLVVLNAVSLGPLALLSRELAFRRRFLLESVPAIVGAGLTVTLALSGLGVWSVVIGDGARSLLALLLVVSLTPVRLRLRWHPRVAGELWRYARVSILASGLDYALLNIDYALVARLLGPIALGYYSLAFRIAILPFFLVTMVAIGAAWPALARLMPDLERVRSAFQSSARLTFGGVLLMAGGLGALAPWVQVLGSRWEPATAVLRLLGVYVVLRSAAYLIGAMFQAMGRPGVNAALRGVWMVLLAVLISVVGRLGITAVGAMQVVAAGLVTSAYIWLGWKLAGLRPGAFLGDMFRPALAAVLAAVAVMAVRLVGADWLSDPTSWLTLLTLSAVFVTAYAGFLLVLAPTLVADVRVLRARLGRGWEQT